MVEGVERPDSRVESREAWGNWNAGERSRAPAELAGRVLIRPPRTPNAETD